MGYFSESSDLYEGEEKIFSITELTREIKILLESNFPFLFVEGEISNYKKHSSGHAYFTLKDEEAQIRCVMWRNYQSALNFTPEDGMKVTCRGALTLYERGGNYQIKITSMQPQGIGDLQIAFEKLKQKLLAEGLFDENHKKPIPSFPGSIGVVTSPTGAAIKDIISVIQRRFPQVQIILVPVNVQGPGAAEEIAEGITLLNEKHPVDVMIIGRGGGSLEDLWSFNEEVVARAIYHSSIPVISAVGHQVDFTISDFVADLRAPTPSVAGELVVPDREELIEQIRNKYLRLDQAITIKRDTAREKIKSLEESYAFRQPENMIVQKAQRIDEMEQRLKLNHSNMLTIKHHLIRAYLERLSALNPASVLERGYSIVTQNDRILTDVSDVVMNKELDIRMNRGSLAAKPIAISKGDKNGV